MTTRALSAPSRFAVRFIETYRTGVASRSAHRCRFDPSCSTYGLDAFHRYGFVSAAARTTWRILRCNPWRRERPSAP